MGVNFEEKKEGADQYQKNIDVRISDLDILEIERGIQKERYMAVTVLNNNSFRCEGAVRRGY